MAIHKNTKPRSEAECFRDLIESRAKLFSADASPKEARRLLKNISAIRKRLDEVAIEAEIVARWSANGEAA